VFFSHSLLFITSSVDGLEDDDYDERRVIANGVFISVNVLSSFEFGQTTHKRQQQSRLERQYCDIMGNVDIELTVIVITS
jgi:hypothetical protein